MRAVRIGAYFLRRGWRLTLGSGRNVILGVFAIAMALLLWGVVLLLQANLTRALEGFGAELRARAYLDHRRDATLEEEVARRLEQSGLVTTVRRVSAEQAAVELTRAFPDLEATAQGVSDVVNGYVEWVWSPQHSESDRAALVSDLKQTAGVAWLDDDRPWRGRMQAAASRLQLLGLILGAVSVVAAAFVTATVVRLAAFRHRIEIEVERLAGATEVYVRAPFLLAGVIQGTAAALLAIGVLYGFWTGAQELAGDSVLTDLVLGSFLLPREIAAVVGVGALAGVAGASVALRPPRQII